MWSISFPAKNVIAQLNMLVKLVELSKSEQMNTFLPSGMLKKIVQLVTILIQEKAMEFQMFLFKFLKNVNIRTLLFVVVENISISSYFNPP